MKRLLIGQLKANLFTSLILIETRSNLDPTFLDKVPIFSY